MVLTKTYVRLEKMTVMTQLDEWSSEVISVMAEIPEISHLKIADLHQISLGLLRRNATRLHAICRYNKGVKKTGLVEPSDVRCIDIHPESPVSYTHLRAHET